MTDASPATPPTHDRRPARALGAVVSLVAVLASMILLPTDQAAARPLTKFGWTTRAATSTSVVQRGRTITVTARVSSAKARTGRVVLVIRDANGRRVMRRAWRGVRFRAHGVRTFTARWVVPRAEPLGVHVVGVRARRAGASRKVHINRNATSFRVRRAPAPPPLPRGVQFYAPFRTPAGFFDRFQLEVFHAVDPASLPADRYIHEWRGDHNHACQAPTTSRRIHVHKFAQYAYWCAPNGPETGHIMTSLYTSGYGQVDFAPKRAFTDVRKICWDQNQTRMGGRKWTQVMVIPEALYRRNGRRLNYVTPALRNEDFAPTSQMLEGDAFMLVMLEGSTEVFSGLGREADFSGFRTTDKAKRYHHCMTDNRNGTISFVLERDGRTDRRTLRGAFPSGPARVIFGDDNYDPPKGDLGYRDDLSTWHWDNITIY